MDDDGDDKDDTKRRTRNLSEKKRRDQFNMLVNELGTMVSTNSRKMDKSTVLKSTISFLRNHNEITVRSRAHDVQEDWKPAFMSNEEFTYLLLESLEGFVLVFSATGIIYYVSESITSLLGHNPADVVNKSIFDFTSEEDRPNLYNLLQRNVTELDQIRSVSKDKEMLMFEVHLRRGAIDVSEETSYELVTFNGHFRTSMEQPNSEQDMSCQQDMDSSLLFVCTGRLHTPQLIRDVSLVDPSRSEFTSRHSLEWKFLFLDHRAPPIIGYLPFEVLGTSGYDYYHFDDLEKVVTCHEALMQKGEMTSCYYRFLTKGQQWIWLQTRFYITYHQWNSKPEFVVCTHRVVSYADVVKSTKTEGAEADNVSEVEGNDGIMNDHRSDDAALGNASPSYMSEASDAFGSTYQTHSQTQSNRPAAKDVHSDDATMAPMSPSYMSEGSEAYAASYRRHSQAGSRRRMKCAHSDDATMARMSPSYLSEASEPYGNSYRAHSRAASVKTASASSTAGTATGWGRANQRYGGGSDNGSVSGESRCSARHSAKEQAHKMPEPVLAPQHGIGAQYLDPTPYVSAVPVPNVVPVPVIVSQDQAQIQEQLQRKHEELQQMIVRQQEELRAVKEQLLLARLGILQPLINVPYVNPEELQQQQHGGQPRASIQYEGGARGGVTYPPPHPSLPPGSHHHMPQ